MKYTIITDSCCDLKSTDVISSQNINFVSAPLTIMVGDKELLDDESLDTKELIASMKAYKGIPKTACPSPEEFAELMRAGDNVICVTLSNKLSGSYESAILASKMVLEENPQKKIFVLDSLTASAGMVAIVKHLKAIIETGKYNFEEVVKQITEVRSKTKTRFLLNDLGNVVKSGRMSKFVGLLASVLTIKPICGDDGNGEIKVYRKALGFKKGIDLLAECADEKVKERGTNLPIFISHAHNEGGASILKKLLESKFGLKNITTFLMRGISTVYAADQGLVMAY